MKNHLYAQFVKVLLVAVVTFCTVYLVVIKNQSSDTHLSTFNQRDATSSRDKNVNNQKFEHTLNKSYRKKSHLRIDIFNNIEEFLPNVEKDNKKWNILSLAEEQVKEIRIDDGIKFKFLVAYIECN